MKNKNIAYMCIAILIVLINLYACDDGPNEVQQIIKLAGKNKKELQTVIDHYEVPKDSLKLRAAYFLIRNMDGQYYHGIEPYSEWDKILRLSDSLINAKDPDYENKINAAYSSVRHKFQFTLNEDLQNIKAHELIGNIEAAFSVWPKPWNRFLDFDGFCDYILPYRQKNELPEIGLRTVYKDKMMKSMEGATPDSLNEISARISQFPHNFKYKRVIPIDQSIRDMEKGKMADCTDHALYTTFKNRSIGIPMAIDFTIWPHFKGTHYWPSVPYGNDSTLPTDSAFFWGRPGNFTSLRKVAKIYRLMYAKQEMPVHRPSGTFLDNAHIKDVTSQYIGTVDLNFRLGHRSGLSKIGYLCVFNDQKWQPIAKAKIKEDNSITFNDVGKGIVYVVFCLNDYGQWIAVSDAKSVTMDGKTIVHKADKSRTKHVTLYRKAKLRKEIKKFGSQMAGGSFQVSDHKDFRTPRSVYRIGPYDTVLLPRTIPLDLNKKYRYVRFTGAGKVEMAEMQWRSGTGLLTGQVIGSVVEKSGKNAGHVFDGDPETYFSSEQQNNGAAWIGLDLKIPQPISELYFAPRSDVNYVKPNDVYELLYWANDGWVSLGAKEAATYSIQYNDVPEKALLWLRNLTEGTEEDLFVYEHGGQIFWNSLE